MVSGHPVFAAIYNRVLRTTEANFLGPLRMSLLWNLNGRVLDLGAGTGANLPYFPRNVEVVALEPDPHMRKRAEKRESLAKVTWVGTPAEAIPFENGYFDAAVAALVFCTVKDADCALTEVYRVLRPGGRLIFLEHVASHKPVLRQVQNAVNPVWQLMAAGCNLTRDTLTTIQAAGFHIVWQESRQFPLYPFIWGEARKV